MSSLGSEGPALAGLLLALLFLLGLLVGSFLNVVIYRVPRGQSVVRPRSACPSCGTPIGARDNIPVLSWLLLRGHCRACGAPIPSRYPLVELTTGIAWAVTGAWALAVPDRTALLPLLLILVSAGIALAFIDVEHHRLPNSIVLPLYPVTIAGLAFAGMMNAEWPWREALIGLGAWLLLIGGLWLLSGGRGMGFGDVKLAPVLGATLGWVSVSSALTGLLAAFVLGAAVGIGILVARRTPAPVSTAVPDTSGLKDLAGTGEPAGTPMAFGPFLLAGAALGLVVGPALGDAYLSIVGWS